MEKIRHYVFSSRPVGKSESIVTYLEKDDIGRKQADRALPHFNLGKYEINIKNDASNRENYSSESPVFITLNDNSELIDFQNYPNTQFKPDLFLQKIFEEIFTDLKKEDKLLYIYLHGFGNDSESEKNKQVIPMTQCFSPHTKNNNSPVGNILFLTWPSQGFLQYKHGEREDVSKMANLTAVFFLKLYYYVNNSSHELFKNWKPKIVFHAQSMGNKILLGAVNRINFLQGANLIKKNILDGFFHRIIMTGADIDLEALNDVDDDIEEEIHQWAKRVILFYNKKDRALWISRFIFFSGRRLGRNINDEILNNLPPNVELVELHGNGQDFIGHNYFTEQPAVAKNLCRALEDYHFDGSELTDRPKRIEFFIEEEKFESEYLA